jgi:hypothetical protein
MAIWELRQVEDIEWRQDDSGYYASIVHVRETGEVRLDIMSTDNNPLISFQGSATAVCKNAMRYIDENCINVSAEYAAYIGYELAKAELVRGYYVQG